jgi:SAM-dependent methyltransferase
MRCFAEDGTEFAPPPSRPRYEGRARYLRPGRLREVWFRVTDRCNLTCRHCLVASGPTRQDGLPRDELCSAIRQAVDLGADTCYFTGGEPFLRPDMQAILREVTTNYGATAVVITNGTLLDAPLTAEQARTAVAGRLGYDNVRFRRGYLEALPVLDASADAAISNCVINLSLEKLRVFAEIRHALRPGGRAVISDIVSERPLPPEVRFNPRLRGECIAGAMAEHKLLRTLAKPGFERVEVLAKTAWRVVEGVPFYSLTVRATRPAAAGSAPPPPLASMPAGTVAEGVYSPGPQAVLFEPLRHPADCLVRGAPLMYLAQEEEARCHYCGEPAHANAGCARGHFVCHRCHVGDRLSFVKFFCARSADIDPIALSSSMRRTHLFPVHGPNTMPWCPPPSSRPIETASVIFRRPASTLPSIAPPLYLAGPVATGERAPLDSASASRMEPSSAPLRSRTGLGV